MDSWWEDTITPIIADSLITLYSMSTAIVQETSSEDVARA